MVLNKIRVLAASSLAVVGLVGAGAVHFASAATLQVLSLSRKQQQEMTQRSMTQLQLTRATSNIRQVTKRVPIRKQMTNLQLTLTT
jgi:hypothetical protein